MAEQLKLKNKKKIDSIIHYLEEYSPTYQKTDQGTEFIIYTQGNPSEKELGHLKRYHKARWEFERGYVIIWIPLLREKQRMFAFLMFLIVVQMMYVIYSGYEVYSFK